MKKNVIDILDIHTHKREIDSQGKSIINYPLLTDSPLYMPLAKNAEVAVGRGLLLEEYLGLLNKGEGLVDTLSNNVFSARKGYYYSAGIHPWELAERNADQQLAFLQKQLKHKQFVAVGETGLDKLAAAPMELQLTMFKKQVQLSEKHGLPLIIHCVRATDELLAVKKEFRPQQAWVWHGFRGKPEQAVQLLKKGFYLSFGGYYPDETMQTVPDERLFLETDNSSLDIEDILCRAAKVRGVEVEALRETIRRNIQNVFFRA